MITCDDVLEAFRERWAKLPELSDLIPGGVWFGRVPPESAIPYAAISIEAEPPVYLSTTKYTQAFTVALSVWSEGMSDRVDQIHQAIHDAYDNRQTVMVVRNARLVRVRPIGDASTVEPQLRDAKDQQLARFPWRVVVEGTRASR